MLRGVGEAGLLVSALVRMSASSEASAFLSVNILISVTRVTAPLSSCLTSSAIRLASASPAETISALIRSSTLTATPAVVPCDLNSASNVAATCVASALASGNTCIAKPFWSASESNCVMRSSASFMSAELAPTSSEFVFGSAMTVIGSRTLPRATRWVKSVSSVGCSAVAVACFR